MYFIQAIFITSAAWYVSCSSFTLVTANIFISLTVFTYIGDVLNGIIRLGNVYRVLKLEPRNFAGTLITDFNNY